MEEVSIQALRIRGRLPPLRKTRTANEKEPFQPWAELRGLT